MYKDRIVPLYINAMVSGDEKWKKQKFLQTSEKMKLISEKDAKTAPIS